MPLLMHSAFELQGLNSLQTSAPEPSTMQGSLRTDVATLPSLAVTTHVILAPACKTFPLANTTSGRLRLGPV